MTTLADLHALISGAPELQQRFQASRLRAAWNVLNEDPATASHTARIAWANKVVANYGADLDKEYRRFLSNPTVQASGNGSTDNDIDFVVASFLNIFAGA